MPEISKLRNRSNHIYFAQFLKSTFVPHTRDRELLLNDMRSKQKMKTTKKNRNFFYPFFHEILKQITY